VPPWERGTNENTDGFFRDWLPKGKSLDDATGAEVQKAYNSLNRGLCKRLSWKCLWKVYHHKTLHLL